MSSITIKEALRWGRYNLSQTSDSASLDALVLLSHVFKKEKTYLLAYSEKLLSDTQEQQFREYIHRRLSQEPIPYLTGQCEFWSLEFEVNPNCLIPRADTEVLIKKILSSQALCAEQQILDLGTGSGVIGIVLALEKPHWSITATDLSPGALAIAQKNAYRLGAVVHYRYGNWFHAVPQKMKFHHIISNPPYLAYNDHHLKSALRYEPQSSLVSGHTGLEDLYQLIQQARFYLTPNGCLWLEQGHTQSSDVKAMMFKNGYTHIQQYKDLSGTIRVTKGSYRPSHEMV